MSDSENPGQTATLPAEDKERVSRLTADIMEPALRKAITQAVAEAPEMEVISAIANAYAALLIETLGAKPAAGFLRAHADHIDSLEEKSAMAGKH
ncbi:hypothetical protein [Nisaea sp.]|uniref:hypothetical protein n=1 Tax=Nisaea sp. TaxID=2024842 RepID=UPI003264EF55